MCVDIVIRTYDRDLPWLWYALRSIHKYVTGYRRIIVAIPSEQTHLLRRLTAEHVVGVPDMYDGYLGQQLTKMQAWKLTNADAILFWDSDVVATQPIDVQQEYFKDGKPILYKTRYDSIPGCPWRSITEKAVGRSVEWEYMRRMPIVHLRTTLEATEQAMVAFHSMSLSAYLEAQPAREFSEFNVLGVFADTEEYHVVDTESVEMPPNKVHQMWSWGGITVDVIQRFKTYGLA